MDIVDFLKKEISDYMDFQKVDELVINIYCNECFEYKGINNFFSISFGALNKDDDIGEMADVFECIDDNEKFIINPESYDGEAQLVVDYLKEIGINNIGYENIDDSYNDDMEYIGKGPNGLYELIELISKIIVEVWKERDYQIPVLFVDYEASWFLEECTKLLNGKLKTKSKNMVIYD